MLSSIRMILEMDQEHCSYETGNKKDYRKKIIFMRSYSYSIVTSA